MPWTPRAITLRASRSLALVYGRPAALRISDALFGLVVALTLLPWGALGLLAFLIGALVAV